MWTQLPLNTTPSMKLGSSLPEKGIAINTQVVSVSSHYYRITPILEPFNKCRMRKSSRDNSTQLWVAAYGRRILVIYIRWRSA